MILKLYNDRTILAPLKCGSRYLEKVFGKADEEIGLLDLNKKLHIEGLTLIVLRSPIEHLASALHTEILSAYGTSKTIDEVLDTFLISNENRFWQSTHWNQRLYSEIYWYWRRNRNYVTIRQLKNLSSYIEDLGIPNIPEYDSSEYDFHGSYKYWCSKEDMMFFIKNNYETHWNNLMNQIAVSDIYWNHIMNREVIEIQLI
jgi:hypothetical protein